MIYDGNCRLGDLFSSRREKGRLGLPTLSVTLNNGLVNREDLDRKQDTNLTPEQHLLVKPGDIAYNMMRMWQGAFGLANREGLVSPAYVVLKPKAGIDPLYASYLLRGGRMIYLLWAYSYGLTDDRLRLYFADFSRIPATVPDISQQRKIARILKTWDQTLDATRSLLAICRQEKQTLMRQLLAPHHPSDWKKNSWQRVPMGEVVAVDLESLPNDTPGDYRFRYISLADVNDGKIATTVPSCLFDTAPSRARRVVKPGDILMSTVRPNLRGYAKVSEEYFGCIASTGFAVLSCRDSTNLDYVYHYLFSDDIQRQLIALVAGSNYPAINSSEVEDLLINIPAPEMQERVVRLLDAQDCRISALVRQIDVLTAEKTGLMQRLLRGDSSAVEIAATKDGTHR